VAEVLSILADASALARGPRRPEARKKGAAVFGRRKQQRFKDPTDKQGQAYVLQNFQTAKGLQDAGLRMEKAWITTGDDRVCDLCRRNEKVGWIPLDDSFPSRHMHPLGHQGCRCDLLTRRRARRRK